MGTTVRFISTPKIKRSLSKRQRRVDEILRYVSDETPNSITIRKRNTTGVLTLQLYDYFDAV